MSQLSVLFGNIASAIRGKTGSAAQIAAINFPDAISNIPTSISGEFTPTSSPSDYTIAEAIGKSNIIISATESPSGAVCCASGVVLVLSGSRLSEGTYTFNSQTGVITLDKGAFGRGVKYSWAAW